MLVNAKERKYMRISCVQRLSSVNHFSFLTSPAVIYWGTISTHRCAQYCQCGYVLRNTNILCVEYSAQ